MEHAYWKVLKNALKNALKKTYTNAFDGPLPISQAFCH
jgi:hypothetical protein